LSYKINNIVDVNILTDTLYRGAINFRAPPHIIPPPTPPSEFTLVTTGMASYVLDAVNDVTISNKVYYSAYGRGGNGGVRSSVNMIDWFDELHANWQYNSLAGNTDGTVMTGNQIGEVKRKLANATNWDTVLTGDNMYAIACDGVSTWVAGSIAGKAKLTVNNGGTWVNLPDGLNSGKTGAYIRNIYCDHNGTWIGVVDGGYAAISVDNGFSWNPLPRNLGGVVGGILQGVAGDGEGRWLISEGGVTHRSTDNGQSWAQISTGLAGYFNQIDTTGGVWMGAYSGASAEVYSSIDTGDTWQVINLGASIAPPPTILSIYTDSFNWIIGSNKMNGWLAPQP